MLFSATNARSQVGDMPLFYTEYNDGLYNPAEHDYPSAAAFTIKTVTEINDILDIYSFWTFTDIFEEGGFVSTPFHSGYGMKTVNNVPKPSWRAFEILHQTGGNYFPVTAATPNTTAGVWVTTNQTHAMVLCWNYDVPSNNNNYSETITVELSGLNTNGWQLQATLTRIDQENSNPYSVWFEMGSPEYPSNIQIQQMLLSSQLRYVIISPTILDSNTIAFTVSLPVAAVAVITFNLPSSSPFEL